MMPFRYTASMSVEDAAAEASELGVRFSNISIEPMYEAFMDALAGEFADLPANITEETFRRVVVEWCDVHFQQKICWC